MSCEEDFNVMTDSDPIPVIYCLLSPDSDTQIIRLGASSPDPDHYEFSNVPKEILSNAEIYVSCGEILRGITQ